MLRIEYGAFVFKVHGGPFQRAGLPDVLACVKGLYVAIEVKVPGETPTDLQKITIKDIKKAGGIAFSATSVKQARKKLEKALNARLFSSTQSGKVHIKK